MLLSDIVNQLASGELSQLDVGGDNSGVIATSDYPKLINLINSGILEIYTRFPLKEDHVFIDQYEHITRYNLDPDYALSNTGSTQPYKYINDLGQVNNFVNNIILITKVANEEGTELSLNLASDFNSIYTPEPNVVQIPRPIAGNTLSVTYKASPVKIATTITDPTTVIIPLQNHFLNAIVAYVAQIIFRTINSDGQRSETDMFDNIFEKAIANITELGLINTDENLNDKFRSNGWV